MRGALQLVESASCAEAHNQAVEGLMHRLRYNSTENRSILLLISGGSNMGIAVQALSQLDAETLGSITVAQTEERFVPVDDPRSNWNTFIRSFGSVDMLAGILPILHEGVTYSETVNNYDLELTMKIKEVDYSIALVGLHEDGGIAGMRPAPAHDFQLFFNDDFVTGYEADDFKRITVTDYGLKVLSDIMVYACGPEKKQTLANMELHKPVHEHPAQLLKVYDRVTLYTSKKSL